jgi:predicted nucleic acid-binding protein
MLQEQRRVFLDASVLIAAAASPSGGSSLLLEICCGKGCRAVTTKRVLLEAQRNVRKKFSEPDLIRFYREIASLELEIAQPATEEELAEYAQLIDRKDAHVLAAAIKSGASFLVTLDRKHFMTRQIREAGLPLSILTPGEFIRQIMPLQ